MAELELRKLKNKISGNINYSCYFLSLRDRNVERDGKFYIIKIVRAI